jgi:hypothetical protein
MRRIHARFSIETAHSRRYRPLRKKAETIIGDKALTIATNRLDAGVHSGSLPPPAMAF